MSDPLETFTRIINSPPGQLAAGGVLAGLVWKFFERVENILSDDTKREIAHWLLGIQTAKMLTSWPDTLASVFDRVFGTKHLSWRCFWRSSVASVASVGVISFVLFLARPEIFRPIYIRFRDRPLIWVTCVIVANIIPDYVSLLESRLVLSWIKARFRSLHSVRLAAWVTALLLAEIVFTFVLADFASLSAKRLSILGYRIVTDHSIAAGTSDWCSDVDCDARKWWICNWISCN
jgi:hypothetical protein